MQGVAGKAERVAVSLALSEALVASASLHDVGYAPDSPNIQPLVPLSARGSSVDGSHDGTAPILNHGGRQRTVQFACHFSPGLAPQGPHARRNTIG